MCGMSSRGRICLRRVGLLRLLPLLALGVSVAAPPAEGAPPPIWAMIWDDLMRKPHESEWRNLWAGISGRVGFSTPLKKIELSDASGVGSEGERLSNMTATLTVSYNPASYLFATVTGYQYINPGLQRPWNPDFTYAFGYNDWHPHTVSIVYANYGGNRFSPNRGRGEKHTHFDEGAVSVGYKFPFPEALESTFIPGDGSIGCSVGFSLTPRYTDLATLSKKRWKRKLNAGFKYTIAGWWYVNATMFVYPWPEQKQPWDPDYTYGFGYFDWHPGTVTVAYNNYGANRFPWRSEEGAGFTDGSVSASWSWSW